MLVKDYRLTYIVRKNRSNVLSPDAFADVELDRSVRVHTFNEGREPLAR